MLLLSFPIYCIFNKVLLYILFVKNKIYRKGHYVCHFFYGLSRIMQKRMFVCFTLLNQFLKEFNEYFIVQKQFLKKTIAYTGAIQ